MRVAYEERLNGLYGDIGWLTTQLTRFRKKNLALNLSRVERLRLVERENEELSMRIQLELLSLNRAGVYYQPQLPSPAEVQLKHRIDEIYTKWPFYGSRKIWTWPEKTESLNSEANSSANRLLVQKQPD